MNHLWYVELYHVTPSRNLPSIKRRGLSPDFSQGKRKAVYFSPDPSFAFSHAEKRHPISARSTYTVFRVLIHRDSLARQSTRDDSSIFYSGHTVSYESLTIVGQWKDLESFTR